MTPDKETRKQYLDELDLAASELPAEYLGVALTVVEVLLDGEPDPTEGLRQATRYLGQCRVTHAMRELR